MINEDRRLFSDFQMAQKEYTFHIEKFILKSQIEEKFKLQTSVLCESIALFWTHLSDVLIDVDKLIE